MNTNQAFELGALFGTVLYIVHRISATGFRSTLLMYIGLIIAVFRHASQFSSPSPLHLIALTTCATLGFFGFILFEICGFRAFFHPLNRYPGPFLARLTQAWSIKASFEGRQHKQLLGLHQKYGQYVRIGPNELSISDPSTLSTIYGNPGWKKSRFYNIIGQLKGQIPALEDITDHQEHTRRRRTWDAGFTAAHLSHYQGLVRSKAIECCEAILSRGKLSPVDLRREVGYYTWTIMYSLGFGEHGHDLITAGPNAHWENIFEGMKTFLRVLVTLDKATWLVPIATKLKPDPAIVQFTEETIKQYHARASDKTASGDLHEILLAPMANAKTDALRKQLMLEGQSDSMLLIIAGADSTSSVIANIFFHLLTEPGKATYLQLQKAIDEAYLDADELDSLELVKRVPLLEAVINETLRMNPPAPVGPLQREAPTMGAVLGDMNYLPPRTRVVVPQIALSFDPANFKEPERFRPERWMNGEPMNKSAFQPFSLGPYACAGRQVAMQEMRQLVAAMLRRMDFDLTAEFDPVAFKDANLDFFTVSLEEPMPVIVTSRGQV